MKIRLPAPLKSFAKNDDGAIIVEFGLVMPFMLLLFAATVESAHLMWSYQSIIAGVRDANRYMSRVIPADICSSGGSVAGLTTTLKDIVEDDKDSDSLFPASITINSVTPSLSCVTGSYRMNPAPVGTVSANITVQLPLGSILALFGDGLSSVTTEVSDTSRIFGQ